MSLEVELADMFPHTVSIEPWSAQDKYTEPTFGTLASYKARVVGKNRLVRNAQGQQVVSSTTVYIYGYISGLSPLDRLTLPAGNSPLQPPIISIGQEPDGDGGHHSVVYV